MHINRVLRVQHTSVPSSWCLAAYNLARGSNRATTSVQQSGTSCISFKHGRGYLSYGLISIHPATDGL